MRVRGISACVCFALLPSTVRFSAKIWGCVSLRTQLPPTPTLSVRHLPLLPPSSVASSLLPSCPPTLILLLHHIHPFLHVLHSFPLFFPPSPLFQFPIVKRHHPTILCSASFSSSVYPCICVFLCLYATSCALLPPSNPLIHLSLLPSHITPSASPVILSRFLPLTFLTGITLFSVQERWRNWSPCGLPGSATTRRTR